MRWFYVILDGFKFRNLVEHGSIFCNFLQRSEYVTVGLSDFSLQRTPKRRGERQMGIRLRGPNAC